MKLSWDWLDPGAIIGGTVVDARLGEVSMMMSLEGLGASSMKLATGLGLGVAFDVELCDSDGLGDMVLAELGVAFDVELCDSDGLGDMVLAELGVAFDVELCDSDGLGDVELCGSEGLGDVNCATLMDLAIWYWRSLALHSRSNSVRLRGLENDLSKLN